jgi:hypothetical protein
MTFALKLGLVVAFLLLAGVLVYVEVSERAMGRQGTCLSNVYNLAGAADMYLLDYERLPQAAHWVEATREYRLDQPNRLRCPEDRSNARCSYGMNEALDGESVAQLPPPPPRVVLFYETAHPGDNPVGSVSDVISPPRHARGNSYGYVRDYANYSLEVPSFGLNQPPAQARPSHQ